MGVASNPSTFFIPGTMGLTPEDRDYIEKKHPEAQKVIQKISASGHKSEAGVFSHDGIRTNYYISHAKHLKRVVVGFSGANAQFPLDEEHIEYLNSNDCTLICMALPRNGNDFMQRSEKLVRAFLLDPSSPVNILVSPELPIYITTHSSSGLSVLKILGEDGTGTKLRHRFYGVAMMSPPFDVPHASRNHSTKIGVTTVGGDIGPFDVKGFKTKPFAIGPIKIPAIGFDAFQIPALHIPSRTFEKTLPFRRLFEMVADHYSDSPVHKLWFVKAYLAMTSSKESFAEKIKGMDFTMGHVRDIQEYGRAVSDNFQPGHTKDLPMIVMAGDRDACTCWETTRDMAKRMGAEFKRVEGGSHDVVKKDPKLLDMFLEKAKGIEAAHRQQEIERSEIIYVSPPGPRIEAEIIPLSERLRDRARLALQSGARSLNSLACLL